MVRYFLRGLNLPVEHELHGGLNTVGRNPTNEFRLPEASVSSFHAEITVLDDQGGVILRDLQSTNGTFLNGQPVEEAPVLPGSVIQLGSVELRLDAEPFEIRIPAEAAAKVATAAGTVQALEDSTLACSRNPGQPATHQAIGGCGAVVKCPGVFHINSLRAMKLSGGKTGLLLFCPDCNARCEPIPGAPPEAAKKGGLLARLTQTIQLGWKRR